MLEGTLRKLQILTDKYNIIEYLNIEICNANSSVYNISNTWSWDRMIDWFKLCLPLVHMNYFNVSLNITWTIY